MDVNCSLQPNSRKDTYKVGDVAVLFKFRSGKLSHVLPRTLVGNVCSAANDLLPQCEDTLSLDKLLMRELANVLRYQRIGVRT